MRFFIYSFFRYQLPAIVWAGFIYLASSLPSSRLQWWLFHRFDKLIHVGIFFILGLLVYRALHRGGRTEPPRFSFKRVLLMLVIVVGYGLFDELHQAGTPGRSGMDVGDMLADLTGGMLAGTVIAAAHWRATRKGLRT